MSPEAHNPEEHHQAKRLAVWALAVAFLAFIAVGVFSYTALNNRKDLLDQKSGRQVAVVTTCAINKAVIEAGRGVIQGSTLLAGDRVLPGADGKRGTADDEFLPGALSRELQRYGYPTYQERVRRARMAATQYAEAIADTIRDTAKNEGVAVPDTFKDGRLDCSKFVAASKATG